jgi:hypothetical protein
MTFSVDEEWLEGVDAAGRPVWEVRYCTLRSDLAVCAAGAGHRVMT